MKQLWISTALAAALLAGAPAWGKNPAAASKETVVLSKEAYAAAMKKIAAQHEADQKACARVKGDPKDVCEAQKRRARSNCVKEAKAAREAAIRHARVEKVDSTGGVFGGAAGERKPPAPKS